MYVDINWCQNYYFSLHTSLLLNHIVSVKTNSIDSIESLSHHPLQSHIKY